MPHPRGARRSAAWCLVPDWRNKHYLAPSFGSQCHAVPATQCLPCPGRPTGPWGRAMAAPAAVVRLLPPLPFEVPTSVTTHSEMRLKRPAECCGVWRRGGVFTSSIRVPARLIHQTLAIMQSQNRSTSPITMPAKRPHCKERSPGAARRRRAVLAGEPRAQGAAADPLVAHEHRVCVCVTVPNPGRNGSWFASPRRAAVSIKGVPRSAGEGWLNSSAAGTMTCIRGSVSNLSRSRLICEASSRRRGIAVRRALPPPLPATQILPHPHLAGTSAISATPRAPR